MAELSSTSPGAGGKLPSARDIPTEELPILALKNVVVFPGVVLPIHVSRDRSIAAIEAVLSDKRIIGLLTQRDEDIDEPATSDLYTVGTIGQILKVLKMPEGGVRVLTQGLARYRVQKWTGEEPYFKAIVQPLPEDDTDSLQLQAMMRSVLEQFRQYVDVSQEPAAREHGRGQQHQGRRARWRTSSPPTSASPTTCARKCWRRSTSWPGCRKSTRC